MDSNELAVLKLLVVGILGEFNFLIDYLTCLLFYVRCRYSHTQVRLGSRSAKSVHAVLSAQVTTPRFI